MLFRMTSSVRWELYLVTIRCAHVSLAFSLLFIFTTFRYISDEKRSVISSSLRGFFENESFTVFSKHVKLFKGWS